MIIYRCDWFNRWKNLLFKDVSRRHISICYCSYFKRDLFGKIKTRGGWRQQGVDQSFGFALKSEIVAFVFFLVPLTYVVLCFPAFPPLWFQYALLGEALMFVVLAAIFIFAARKRRKKRDAEFMRQKIVEQISFRNLK